MVQKVKICPNCKTWTTSATTCSTCGKELITTEYTDMFFNKISPEEQSDYIRKALGEEVTFKSYPKPTPPKEQVTSTGLGYILQVIGVLFIILGILIGFWSSKSPYGDFHYLLFIRYAIGGFIIGILFISLADIINVLHSINRKFDK